MLFTGLLLGGLAGWLAGRGTLGVALVAVAEIVFLLSPGSHRWRVKMSAKAAPAPAHASPFMTRSRRLAASLRDLRLAAGNLPDAVVLLDDSQRVRWFNHAAELLLGLRRPQDRGKPLPALLPDSPLVAWLEAGARETLHDVIAPGHPDSRLDVSLMPFGKHQRLMLGRDISYLAKLEQVRRDFVANVSHELRTPLTVIHGYLELLDPEDVPELAPMLDEMRAQSRRMGQIVEDLLTLSRLENQTSTTPERVLMAPLLATLRKEAEALSKGRHRIVLQVDTDLDLLGSTKELYSAMSNLVSNAVRYTPNGGSITIAWRREGEGAVYSVRDTGFGIAAPHLQRLTERFYRVSSSRSRDTGGTGLGLAIVKHALNLHHARLTIDSAPGKGSTFACHFDASHVLPPAINGSDGAD